MKYLRNVIFIGALVISGSTMAAAPATTISVPDEMFDWTGFYVGVFGGGATSTVNVSDVSGYNGAGGAGDFSYNPSGFFGGVSYTWLDTEQAETGKCSTQECQRGGFGDGFIARRP